MREILGRLFISVTLFLPIDALPKADCFDRDDIPQAKLSLAGKRNMRNLRKLFGWTVMMLLCFLRLKKIHIFRRILLSMDYQNSLFTANDHINYLYFFILISSKVVVS